VNGIAARQRGPSPRPHPPRACSTQVLSVVILAAASSHILSF
jgi:hypothetical protein